MSSSGRLGLVGVLVMTGLTSESAQACAIGLVGHEGTSLSAGELGADLVRAGLDPESLAAAGVSGPQTASIVAVAAEYFIESAEDLRTADALVTSLRIEADGLRRKIQSGRATAEEIGTLPTKLSSLNAALAGADQILSGVFPSLSQTLTSEQVACLPATRARCDKDPLPAAYRFVDRSQAEIGELRAALAQERIAGADGQTLAERPQQLLRSVRGETVTAATIASLSLNQDAVAEAWASAVQTATSTQ